MAFGGSGSRRVTEGAYCSSCFAMTCVAWKVPSDANVPSTTAPAPSRRSDGGAPGPDDAHARRAVRQDEAQVARLRVVAKAAGLDLSTEPRRGAGRDVSIARLGRREVIHGRAREVLHRDEADEDRGGEHRDQQDAARSHALSYVCFPHLHGAGAAR
jgi:hypothetical protein